MFIVSPESETHTPVTVNYFSLVQSQDKAFLRFHPVSDGELTQGEYIDPDDLVSVLQMGRGNKTNFIPEHILMETNSTLVFFEPTHQRYPVFYRSARKKGKMVARALKVSIPPLLYVVDKHRRGLKIFLLRYNRRPTLTDRLYHAPFPNVSRNGGVCLGNVELPSELEVSNTAAISDAYLNSVKTHLNSTKMFRQGETSEDRWYHYMSGVEEGKRKLRVSDFTVCGTLESLLKGIAK